MEKWRIATVSLIVVTGILCLGQISSGQTFKELLLRPQLTGDWGGERTRLAEKGVTFNIDMLQSFQGVVDGGLEQDWKYGGSLDYWLQLDFQKMGLWPGGFLNIRAETQFGEFINGDTGSLLATNTDGFFPLPNTHTTTLSHVVLTQFLSESMAVFFGKIETLDGDSNHFAGGRGKTQFMNQNFVLNPVTLRSSPYSSMGAGLAFFFPNAAAEKPSTLSFAVLGANGQPNIAGWDDDFEDGANYSVEFKQPTRFFGLDGAHLVGATYNNKDFKSTDQNPRRMLGAALGLGTLAEDEGTWCAYYNFHQYLFTEAEDESQGWGLFGRYGFADDETSPIEDFYSVGVGGKGIFDGRDNDTFGVGYFYIGLSDELPNLVSNRFGDSQGFEVFYNIEVTPSLHITPDLQVINPSRESNQTAVVLGLRAVMTF